MPHPMPLLSLIFARSENDAIGLENDLPWRISGDLKWFKKLTTGHTIIMGRKTFESIGKPLPQRRHIVVTRDKSWTADGVEVVHSIEEAIRRVAGEDEAFIIGGATIYRQVLEAGQAGKVYETLVHAEVDGDTFLEFRPGNDWKLVDVQANQADAKNEFAYTFRTWEKIQAS